MEAQRLSVEVVETDALERLFRQGLRARLILTPVVVLLGMVPLLLDPAPWRRWLVVAVLCAAFIPLITRWPVSLARLNFADVTPVLVVVVMISVVASGGVDSPVFPLLPPTILFVCLVLPTRAGVRVAAAGTVLVWVMAGLAASDRVPTLLPVAFGVKAQVSPLPLLLARAVFLSLALGFSAVLGVALRQAFQSAIQRAVDAHSQELESREESTRTLTTLAGEIAHELKNPLASVKGLAALIDRDLSEGKARERLQVLRREVDRMQEVLESFLTFSRPLVPLDVGVVSVGGLIEQVVALHEGLARERGASFRVEVATALAVRADGRKVLQVLINLVQNALDVTPTGGVIELVAMAHGEGATVSVMDRGPGAQDLERVFDAGVTSKPHGSGLGLTISRLLARQHGGDVVLEPRAGGGVIAELTLPGAVR